jgi:exopolyphosphatase/guanosine-5'-triphosphate,3'-diphosphate pyrophosphatase
MRLGVLDLGTNSFHLTVADVEADGRLTILDDAKELVRLGAPALGRGLLGTDAWRRGMAALETLVRRGRRSSPDVLVAVATSAIREAANGAAFVDAVQAAHALDVHVLTGEEEARLAYAGARSMVPETAEPIAVLDVGGGSVEIAVGRGEACLHAESLPLGVLRLRERFGSVDGVLALQHVQAIADEVRRVAAAAAARARALAPRTLLLVGGTPRRLARMAQGQDGSGIVTRDAITRLAVFLLGRDPSELGALGIEPGRRDTVMPGAIVVAGLMTLLAADTARVVPGGLREGVLHAVATARSGVAAGTREVIGAQRAGELDDLVSTGSRRRKVCETPAPVSLLVLPK